ncbi:hypothetical protein GCM10011348_07260 [Marinobacterium nitratireducens]|uniref:AB hydrolase-1 domain-containing protein n=1 Tax=Marinobacterium nitratireducens TaxID=518897 RepID=A0A917Z8N2_9GAMM|nr:alpha/beta hydrolase [Marinobacterium nitratireducens]GGO77521.1 hypothetical protein GCM10011348_07260 [Marinobacterium nitratireducens]
MLAPLPAEPVSEDRCPILLISSHGWLPCKALLQQLGHQHPLLLASAADPDGIGRQLASPGRPCHLVGHDMGTIPALLTALERPDQLRSLTLINPAAFGLLRQLHDWEGWDAANRLASNIIALQAAGAHSLAARTLVQFWFGLTAWWLLRPGQRQRILRQLPAIVDELSGFYTNVPHRHDLRALNMPVHLICNRRAPLPSLRLARRMVVRIPVATLSPGNRAGENRTPHTGRCASDWLLQLEQEQLPQAAITAENVAWSDAT